MVYIFRQYMYLLLFNCQGKFAILWGILLFVHFVGFGCV